MTDQNGGQLWDEYKYRHQHIWNTVFKLTTAVVVISIVPYVQPAIACVLDWRILLLPAVAIALCVLGIVRMGREMRVFEDTKDAYRAQQASYPTGTPRTTGSSFGLHVHIYLAALTFGATVNAACILRLWIPAVAQSIPSECFSAS